MKLTQGHLRIVIVILGVGLILLGVTKKLIGFELSDRVARWIGTVVICVAAGVFVYSRRLGNIEQSNKSSNISKERKR